MGQCNHFLFLVATGHPRALSHPRGPARPSPGKETRLDIPKLDSTVEHYFQSGLATSTRRTGDNLSYTTVKTYLAAVRQLQVAEGWGDPEMNKMPQLAQVIRGIKAAQVRSPSASSKQSKETAHHTSSIEKDEEIMARRGKQMEQHHAMGGGNHVLFRLPQVRKDHLDHS